jgi:mRNA-degrading endonuclease RelE of RelBE toxin-antitoxin system
MHPVEFHKRARKALQSIPVERVRQILTAIEELSHLTDPMTHPNVRPMQGDWEGSCRMRVSSYRVIFQLVGEADGVWLIRVTHVGSRGDVYG